MEIYSKITCPLMEGEIDDTVCYDIHMVAEDLSPEYFAPEKAVNTPDFKEICLKCPNHRV